jgi:porin
MRVRYWIAAVAVVALVRPTLAQVTTEPLPVAGAFERLTAPANACPCPTDPPLGPPTPPPFGGPIHDRPKLTGDWFGARSGLRDRGITVDVSTTQFYQGVTTGGLEQSFPYGGRNDYFLTLDGEKLGLWRGFSARFHGETRYGESANFITGALSPVNEYLLVPGSEGTVSGLTGAEFTQVLSENLMVSAGKINLLDHVYQQLTGATGLEGFMNLSLIFNPILARTLPYSAFGAGAYYLRDGEPVLTLSVFDTRDASTTSVFDDFFTSGAVIFGTAVLPTNFFGRPGHQGLEGAYSSGRYTNISKSPYLDPVDGLVFPGPPQAGSWALGYLFDQAVWVSRDDPERMWGVFGKLGISDGNPNPVRWTAIGGVSGASPIAGRTLDTFGVGFYHLEISSSLKRSARPLAALRNEQGVELYYNARITPWFQFTPDLQVIEPFDQSAGTALVVGFRAKLDF